MLQLLFRAAADSLRTEAMLLEGFGAAVQGAPGPCEQRMVVQNRELSSNFSMLVMRAKAAIATSCASDTTHAPVLRKRRASRAEPNLKMRTRNTLERG